MGTGCALGRSNSHDDSVSLSGFTAAAVSLPCGAETVGIGCYVVLAACYIRVAVRGLVLEIKPASKRNYLQNAALAQPVEHVIRNDGVRCSSHLSGTNFVIKYQ